MRHLAELGVVFLLFNIGLELSLERLRSMQKQVFGMGTSQVRPQAPKSGRDFRPYQEEEVAAGTHIQRDGAFEIVSPLWTWLRPIIHLHRWCQSHPYLPPPPSWFSSLRQ